MNLVSYMHEGLTQISYRSYSKTSGSLTPGSTFRHTVELNLPLFLTASLWQRHRYSAHDVETTLGYFSVSHLWQCALLFGIPISNSAIYLSFSHAEEITFTSKAVVIRKLLKSLDPSVLGSHSVLEKCKTQHIPPIPIHPVPLVEYQWLKSRVPTQKADVLGPLYYEDFYQ
jgi:hypothetical protein